MNTTRSVLPATKKLLAEISGRADFLIVNAYKNAILAYGSRLDADQALQFFLKDPGDTYAADLLEIIGKWGELDHAKRIFESSIQQDRLRENFPEKVLEVLGMLRFEAAKPVLAHYSFCSSEYYPNKAAVRGLLHFDCSEFQEEIRSGINNILNKNLFPEFLPALICKLKEKNKLLEELYTSGSTIVSTDCNAGIFLGFALSGKEGQPYFKQAVFDPNWEAFYNAAYYVLEGMHHLGISFEEILQEAGDLEGEKELQYYLLVIISLLEVKIASYEHCGETFEQLYSQLLSTGLFLNLAEKAGQLKDAEKVEELLVLKMKEEVMRLNKGYF